MQIYIYIYIYFWAIQESYSVNPKGGRSLKWYDPRL
jgi:hypothetical protein